MKKRLGQKEPVSKQGRKNVKPGPTLDAFDDLDADLAYGMDYMDTKEAVTEGRQSKETEEQNVTHDTKVLEKGGSNEELVNVAGNIGVSTAVNISTASRPEVSTTTPMTPLTTTSVFEDEDIFIVDALVMLSDKAKLKGAEIKEKKDAERPARSDQGEEQIPRDAEIALKVQAELDDEARLERQRQEKAYLNYIANLYDEVQSRIDADHELAVRWTQEEQEKYTVDERAKLLVEYFENRKKQLDKERAAAIRNKPPTKSQLRSLMMTYLKHTGRYKHARLNKKTLEDIQVLYIKEQKKIVDFVPIRSEEDERLIQKMNKKESKFYHLDRHGAECIYYRIFRSDESSRWIKTFFKMVKMFDRLDLEELYNLVMQRFESTTPEGVDLVIWGDLRTIVHTLILEDGTEIHMLAERKYPLTKETLKRMVSLKLIAESASESAYILLSKEFSSPKQMALGKDFSNPLIVDSLIKTIWLSMHHVIAMKHWLFQSKRLLIYSMAGEDEFHDDNPPPPPPPVTPTQQAPHTLSTIKLPILKKGEYDIWAMKMEHYLGHTDYPIWEVIQKGNGPVQVSTDTNGQIRVLPPKTAEEILFSHQAIPKPFSKFHKKTDAKEMWEAIKSRFEGLHKGYDRFQSLLSQLEIHGAGVSTKMPIRSFLDLYLLPLVPRHFARECRSKGNQESQRRDVGNTGYKAKDNERRPGKQKEPKALVTLDREGVDWTGHAEITRELCLWMLTQFSYRHSGDKYGLGMEIKYDEESE
ncbi:hypothetical protein Tco_1253866 [Tanacetum coccineum]